MKERIHYFDIAKALMILFLPIHHYSSAMSRLGVSTSFDGYITDWQIPIVCFFMPGFFLVSGYCSNFDKSNKDFIHSIVTTIIIPFFSITIFGSLIWLILTRNTELLLQNFTKSPYTGLWFLPALAFSKIIYFSLNRFLSSHAVKCFITFILLCLGIYLYRKYLDYNILAIYHGLIASFFIAIGQFFKSHAKVYEWSLKFSLVLFPLCYILTNYIFAEIPFFTAGIMIPIREIPNFIMLSVFGTLFLLTICKLVKSNNIIEYFGKNSLVIYGFHFGFLYFVISHVYFWMNADLSFEHFIAYVVSVYTMELLWIYLTCRICNLPYICYLFGKSKRKAK